jgi:hypothetical protein
MQAVYPHMKAAGWGRIVNFGVVDGQRRRRGFGAYNASKEAIRGVTRTAAQGVGSRRIVVNAIAPAAAPPRAVGSEHYEEFMRTCPMGRNGDPELDIGSVAHFLCTDACRYLTGRPFMVDGGTYLWAEAHSAVSRATPTVPSLLAVRSQQVGRCRPRLGPFYAASARAPGSRRRRRADPLTGRPRSRTRATPRRRGLCMAAARRLCTGGCWRGDDPGAGRALPVDRR